MRSTVCLAFLLAWPGFAAPPTPVHVWQKQELAFTSSRQFANPYTDVTVWVDLSGPGFNKRIYGFWDGGQTFLVRLVATEAGLWNWRSGSNPMDPGLAGHSGSFTATPWSEAEKQANPLRHGFIRPTDNHHALQFADGTPYFAIGDTWYSVGTNRFKWYDDDQPRPMGPTAGFKDYVRYRQAEGYNWVNVIAAFPNWMTDGQPWHVVMNDPEKTTVRSAWLEFGTGSAKNMDNEGGRPFLFPGKVPGYENMFPDINRINPEYFRYVDRKIDYLNEHGFIPFIEVSRRDASLCWKRYYSWPDSYARFIEYVWSRYQANSTVLSPIHLDIIAESVSPADYIAAVKMVKEKHGDPPFGTLLSANANPSTLENWGDESWVTLHQIGNMREHNNYWYLTEIFNAPHPAPALNGEPYYAGYFDARGLNGGYKYGAPGGTEKDDQYVRSAMYGSFLSGGFGGHVYGAEGIWGADIEPSAPTHMWDAFQWKSGAQMQYLRAFALSVGKRYQDLVPDADLVSPNKTHVVRGYEGWSYCARTPDKEVFLLYFEKGCERSQVRGAKLNTLYRAQWFDPRTGHFRDAGTVESSRIGIINLPDFPSDADWGLRLAYEKSGIPVNYDESKVGTYTLPDPLVMADGTPVRDAETWYKKRRPEIVKLFEENMHGRSPAKPADLSFNVFDKGTPAFDGKAIRKQVEIRFSRTGGPKADLVTYIPADARKPVPMVLAIDFSPNFVAIHDPGIRPSEGWGFNGHKQMPSPREQPEIDVQRILAHGFGVAAIYYGDIEPDFDGGLPYGVRELYLKPGEKEPAPDEWGAIAAWAWGLSRAMDYLETDPAVDSRRVALYGLSRLGKTVLWAGAHDTRFALVIDSCSGEGGAALSRRNYGETVKHLNTNFPYWFARNYRKYSDHVDQLPVDAHMLLALIAPRPVYLSTGKEDLWADSKGEFLAAVAAGPVYRLLGKQGLDTETMPGVGESIMHDIGFHMHAEGHGTFPYDWDHYLKFLEMHLRAPK